MRRFPLTSSGDEKNDPVNSQSLLVKSLVFYGCQVPDHPGKWRVHEAMRKLLGVTVDEECEIERRGSKFFVNPSDFEHADIFWFGKKDMAEIEHMRRLLPAGSVILDIGANLGFYSLELARDSRLAAAIHAFEPHPGTHRRLVRHITANGLSSRITPHTLALSDTAGHGHMSQCAGNSGATHLSNDASGLPVVTTTLDAFVSRNGLTRLDALKIDVEGMETAVLRGGLETLERFKPMLVIEFWPFGLERAGTNSRALADLIGSAGYTLHDPRTPDLSPFPPGWMPSGADLVNVVCLHKDRTFGRGSGARGGGQR